MKTSVDNRNCLSEKKQRVSLIYGERIIKTGKEQCLRQKIYAKNCTENNNVTFRFLDAN